MIRDFRLTICWGGLAMIFCGCATQRFPNPQLGYRLPVHAQYSVTDEQVHVATDLLKRSFAPDTNQLTAVISAPCLCGPGLWRMIKDSPYFSVPLRATSKAIHPVIGRGNQEFPMGLIQDEGEAARFRGAMAELLSMNGTLSFRLPNEEEFNKYWSLSPWDRISEPLIVAEGERFTFIIAFGKKKPFWVDEIQSLTLKQPGN